MLASLALIALASAGAGGLGLGPSEAASGFSGGCSFEMLTFYYDDDGELQCECLDDADDEDWGLGQGLT
jgi:hypothetical protein